MKVFRRRFRAVIDSRYFSLANLKIGGIVKLKAVSLKITVLKCSALRCADISLLR